MMDTGSRFGNEAKRAQFLLTFFFGNNVNKFIKVRHGEGLLDERWQRGFTHADTVVGRWWCEKKS